jgi:hypothetical protein
LKTITKRRIAFLAGFAIYFSLLWTFWETPFVYPLKIFVVLLHEVSHAIAIAATGGVVQRITLDPLQGGATWGAGGSRVIALSAGYLGSLMWGFLLVLAARSKRIRAGMVVGLVGAMVAALTVFYVRSPFGVVFGLAFGAALVLAGTRFSELWNRRLLLVLGLTSCLYAILDIKSDIIDRPDVMSDARMLAETTGIPTLVWGILWIGIALGFSAWLFRKALAHASKPVAPNPEKDAFRA